MEIVSQNQKSQLAKLLASENITVQHQPGVKTAMFDVKNRVLILPVWREMSNDLYDMLVVHEVGHALDTPDDFVPKVQEIATRLKGSAAVIKDYLNVVEDARIDKRQKRRFPGSRRNYVKGYQELIDRDFFGTSKLDINALPLVDRLNIHFKGGALLGIKFSAEERPFVKRMEDAETFEEVLSITEELYAFAKQKKQNQSEGDDGEGEEAPRLKKGRFEDSDEFEDFEDSDEDFDWGEPDEDDSDESEDDSDDGQSDGEGDESDEDDDADADGEPDDSDDESEGDDQEKMDAGATKESMAEDEPDAPVTEKAWQKKQEELLANSDIEYVYFKLPKPDLGRLIDDYKVVMSQQKAALMHGGNSPSWYQAVRDELNQFKASENATISYMVKEFEMRKSADEYSRTSLAKTGVIDTNKLHSYKYNDDLFRRITTVATGKNHGFVMFIDWSGSMDVSIKKTLKQLFSLVWFCKRVQVPFEVYSFRSANSRDRADGVHPWSQGPMQLQMKAFKLRNLLSSRMSLAEMNEAMYNLFCIACGAYMPCDSLMATPLNEAIVAAEAAVNLFKSRSKVQVVNTVFLTDGDSDGNYEINGLTLNSGYDPFKKTRKFILQDDVTKKSHEFPLQSAISRAPNDGRRMTITLLKILKDRTGSNLIGFFIFTDGFRSLMSRFYGYNYDDTFAKTLKKEYDDNGFISVTSDGYDENFVIRSSSMDIKKVDLKVDSSMTKGKIAKAFMSFAEKKALNRVMLQKLVKRIAA